MKKSSLKYIITILATICIFAVLFVKIDFSLVISRIKQVDPGLFLAALIVSVLSNIVIPTEEWRLILKPMGCRIPFWEAAFIKLGTRPIKGILPLKSGELMRPYYLQRVHGFPFSSGLLSILITLAFNFLSLPLIILLGCVVFRANPYKAGYLSAVFLAFSFLVGFLLKKNAGKNKNGYALLEKLSPKLNEGIKSSGVHYSSLGLRSMALPFFYAVLAAAGSVLTLYILTRALGADIPLSALFIFTPLVILATHFPITVSGLGLRESATVVFFSPYASPEVMLSAGILLSFVDAIFPTMIGLVFTRAFLGKTWDGDRQAEVQ